MGSVLGSDLSCGDPVSSKLSKMFAAVLSTSLLPRSAYLSGTHQREGTADGAEAAGEGVVAAGIEDDMVEAVAGVLDGSQRGTQGRCPRLWPHLNNNSVLCPRNSEPAWPGRPILPVADIPERHDHAGKRRSMGVSACSLAGRDK